MYYVIILNTVASQYFQIKNVQINKNQKFDFWNDKKSVGSISNICFHVTRRKIKIIIQKNDILYN